LRYWTALKKEGPMHYFGAKDKTFACNFRL